MTLRILFDAQLKLEQKENRRKLPHAKRDEQRLSGCVYCEDLNHKAVRCPKVINPNERKQILVKKGCALIKCVTKFHRASDCNRNTSSTATNEIVHQFANRTIIYVMTDLFKKRGGIKTPGKNDD